ncbi:MAG: RHS repeat protein [Myxococcales bacterium]
MTIGGVDLERSYGYDENGNLTDYTDRDGRRTHYQYDTLNRKTDETWFDESDDPTGYSATYSYTIDNSLHTVTAYQGASVASSTTYTYDTMGRPDDVTRYVNGAGSFDLNYDYNSEGFLYHRTIDAGLSSLLVDTSYSYDYEGRPGRLASRAFTLRPNRLNTATCRLAMLMAGNC